MRQLAQPASGGILGAMRAEQYGPSYEPKATTIDPDKPVYLVTFWRPVSKPGTPDELCVYESDERILRDTADVTEVFAWAKENAGPDRTYMIHVASIEEDGHSDMIKLYGTNPNIHYFEDHEPFRRVTDQDPQVTPDIFLTS
jgi:hypothetical protein